MDRLQLSTDKQTYYGIDFFKLICAFLVIGIHTEPFSFVKLLDMGFGTVTRIAVPFFFMSSAFFFFQKKNSFQRLVQYIKRIFILYFVWSVIYFLVDIIYLGFSHQMLYDFLVDFFLKGYKHFWFLHASIIGIVIVAVLDIITKRNKIIIYSIVLALYFYGVLISTYSNIFLEFEFLDYLFKNAFVDFFGTRNGFFYAPAYMALGYSSSLGIKKLSQKKTFLGIFICFLLLVCEGIIAVLRFNATSTILWFSVFPLMYFIFNYVKNVTIIKRFDFTRKISTLLYCIHPLIILAFTSVPINNLLKFVLVSVSSSALSLIILKIGESKKFSMLQYLS